MGQKANPIGLRTGQIYDWKSRWFAARGFRHLLKEDYEIRKIIRGKLAEAAVTDILITRTPREITITVKSPRPGVIIGRGGTGVEDIKKVILQKLKISAKRRLDLKLNIEEVKDAQGNAAVIARNIAEQLEKRLPFRRAVRQTLERAKESAGVKGVRVGLSGRLNAADMGRSENFLQGNVPLHTLRANIDFARDTARTNVGAVGIKVWVYKGEVFKDEIAIGSEATDKPAPTSRHRRKPEVLKPRGTVRRGVNK